MGSDVRSRIKAREAAEEVFELAESLSRDVDAERFWEVLSSKIPHQPVKRERLSTVKQLESPSDNDPFPFKVRGIEGLTYGEVDDAYYRYLSSVTWIDEWPQVLAYIQENNLDV